MARSKEEMIRDVGRAVRTMGAQSVLSSAAIAKHFDLHPTDLEVLDLIYLRKQVSPGDLGNATGLTSGSITALINRLLEKGLITREVDPSDRRRAVIRLNRTATAPIEAAYAPRQQAMFTLWSTFAVRDLEIIADFLDRSTALLVECTQELANREGPSETPDRRAQ